MVANKYGEIDGDIGKPPPLIAGFLQSPLRPRTCSGE